ncbi:MAG: hypothetical protein ACLUEK_12390 [Oscillospiraceae bacterium]
MAFSLKEINYRTVADPSGFMAECDARYAAKIRGAADMSRTSGRAPSSCSPPLRQRQDDHGPEDRGRAHEARRAHPHQHGHFRTVDLTARAPRRGHRLSPCAWIWSF